MMNLESWSVDAQDGEGDMEQPEPRRVERSHIELEVHLEDWIAKDPMLLLEEIRTNIVALERGTVGLQKDIMRCSA